MASIERRRTVENIEQMHLREAPVEHIARAVLAQADKVIEARAALRAAEDILRDEQRTLEIIFDGMSLEAKAALLNNPNHWSAVYGNLPNDLSANDY